MDAVSNHKTFYTDLWLCLLDNAWNLILNKEVETL